MVNRRCSGLMSASCSRLASAVGGHRVIFHFVEGEPRGGDEGSDHPAQCRVPEGDGELAAVPPDDRCRHAQVDGDHLRQVQVGQYATPDEEAADQQTAMRLPLPRDPQLGDDEHGQRHGQVDVRNGHHSDQHPGHEEDEKPTRQTQQPPVLQNMATQPGEQRDGHHEEDEAEVAQEDRLGVIVRAEQRDRRRHVVVERRLERLVGEPGHSVGLRIDGRGFGISPLADGQLLRAGERFAQDGV